MSKLDRGRKITISYKDKGPSGMATLVIDVSADEGELPHEHRDDLKDVAAELLGVPLESLKDIQVELKRNPGHTHPHPHPAAPKPSSNEEPEKQKA